MERKAHIKEELHAELEGAMDVKQFDVLTKEEITIPAKSGCIPFGAGAPRCAKVVSELGEF